jgi:hypothetical protein
VSSHGVKVGVWHSVSVLQIISQYFFSKLNLGQYINNIVAYLPHARKVELQNQSFLSNTRTSNGTAGLHDAFVGYG